MCRVDLRLTSRNVLASTSAQSFIRSASFFCSCRSRISSGISLMRFSRSSSDCAIFRARGFRHVNHVALDVSLQRLGGDSDSGFAVWVLVFPAPVAATLPRLEVATSCPPHDPQ
jgi:hypothetical protein